MVKSARESQSSLGPPSGAGASCPGWGAAQQPFQRALPEKVGARLGLAIRAQQADGREVQQRRRQAGARGQGKLADRGGHLIAMGGQGRPQVLGLLGRSRRRARAAQRHPQPPGARAKVGVERARVALVEGREQRRLCIAPSPGQLVTAGAIQAQSAGQTDEARDQTIDEIQPWLRSRSRVIDDAEGRIAPGALFQQKGARELAVGLEDAQGGRQGLGAAEAGQLGMVRGGL